MDPLVKNIWQHFFRHCPAGTEVVLLSETPTFAPNWDVPLNRAKFSYPKHNLRFTRSMMDFMHAGVQASQVNSTVTFLSDTSVPLKSCSSVTKTLDKKIYVHLTSKQRKMCIKGSQWMSLPRLAWIEAYTQMGNKTEQSSYCGKHHYGAPDETFVQTYLYRQKPRVNRNTHAIFWTAAKYNGGHPETLTDEYLMRAVRQDFCFARKFDSRRAKYNFNWLER